MIAETWPDTFARIEPTRDPARFVFSERISERPTEGMLDNAVLVSPVTGEHEVKHTRSGLEIRVIGGFQPDLVYRVRLLPTIKDLFNNTLEGPFELVFSTGADFENNVVAGIVKDRITGEAVNGARVEARMRGEDDPPVYVAASDSAGVFALRYLPAGAYDLTVYQDINRNGEPDFREMQGSAESSGLGLEPPGSDTLIIRELSLLMPDTVPSRVVRVEAVDSTLVHFTFDDYMDAEGPLDSVQVVIAPPPQDTLAAAEEIEGALAIERLLWPRQVDSLQAVTDSIAAEERRLAMVDSLQAVADTLAQVLAGFEAAGDTLGIDTVSAALERVTGLLEPPEPPEPPPGAAEDVPVEPPPILPQQEFFVKLAEPLAPNQAYRAVLAGVVNINGLGGGGGEASFAWEPPPQEVPDTAATLPDTGAVAPPDTGAVAPPDTGALALPAGAGGGLAPSLFPLPIETHLPFAGSRIPPILHRRPFP
jgi:hypothetical protein